MALALIGPKELARRLEVDLATAKAILAAIADFQVTNGVRRLTEQGYEKWYRAKLQEGIESKTDGKIQTRQRPVGSKAKAAGWKADLSVLEDGGGSGEAGGHGGRRSA